ncbi:MAG: homoserine kinase [Actinomycetota bacterium]
MIVRVPGSSANLGPGFDTLGLAIGLHVELGVIDGDLPDGARRIEQRHPGQVAFRAAGGDGELWERCSLPMGRGLGFSGAVRVGGALLGVAQRSGVESVDAGMQAEVLALTTELEGHADNVAASIHGGVVAAAAGRVVRVPLAFDPAVVVWIPSFVTKTDESRRVLPETVPFADAVFSVGRVALLVAALAVGDIDALRSATEDRLHQPMRLALAEPSRKALESALDAGAWCSWLSGSGPSIAALCAPDDAERLAAALPESGRTKVLRIDRAGAVLVAP